MVNFYFYPLIYFLIISLITFLVTCYDKICAKKHRRRVSEAALLTLAFFGGALAEYTTMKIIRHKTLHKKFMIGLPLIILIQICSVAAMLYFSWGQ